MKILFHHRTLGDGAEGIHINEMIKAFTKLGHEVVLTGPAAKVKSVNKFQKLKKVVKGPFYELMETAYNFVGFYNLDRAIKNFQPDFIYDRYMIFNASAVLAGKKNNIPVFLEMNAPIAFERYAEPDEFLYLRPLAFNLEKGICCAAFRTIAVSTPLKKYFALRGVPFEKIMVLPNGVNLEKFKPGIKKVSLTKKLGIPETAKVIGFTGILRAWHGIEILLMAFKKVKKKIPDSYLLLVGDGPAQSDIEQTCINLGIVDRVKITGRISHNKIKSYIDLFDVAVSPKTTFYASPMKIPEYMAMGKCIVAPDTDNIRDLILNGITGIMFEKDNVDALADSLTKALTDNELNKKISANALKKAETDLSWITNAQKVIDEYRTYFKN